MKRSKPSHSPRRTIPGLALTLALASCTNEGSGTSTGDTGSSSGSSSAPDSTTEVEPTGGATEPGTSGTGSTSSTSSTSITSETSSDTGSSESTEGADASSTADTGSTDASSTDTGSTADTGDTGDTEDTGVVPEEFIKVQIVALNDFHGNLEPPAGSNGQIAVGPNMKVDVGGAAFLADRVAALRAENPNTVVVSAGDLIGASPLVSALFHDEPTIEVMNQIGLDYNAVGNHEFDHGVDELLRMQEGGCHPLDGCLDGTPFPGASFQFLAANVLTSLEPLETLFPAFAVHEVGGVKIGFIGMTLEGTAGIVTPIGNEGLTFLDEVERANAQVPVLLDMGVEAIVVLVHEGGFQGGFYDECAGISGPIVDIVEGLDDEIDVVITGHTHQAYNCIIADKIVTSAASNGRALTDIDLEISSLTGHVTAATASNVLVTRDMADPEVAAFVAGYKQLVAPLANKQIGTITATLNRHPPMMKPGLSTMGAVLADAHLAATKPAMLGGSQMAFMNPGGVRADLLYPASNGEAKDGIVSYGEAFSVQPFGNSLVVMTLTGAQIKTLLEQQFSPGLDNVLHVSKGFTYTYSQSAPIGKKVDAASIKLDGALIAPAQKYRVTVISYLAAGGDSFSVLVDGTERLGGITDMQALEQYLAKNSPVSPPPLDRITVVP